MAQLSTQKCSAGKVLISFALAALQDFLNVSVFLGFPNEVPNDTNLFAIAELVTRHLEASYLLGEIRFSISVQADSSAASGCQVNLRAPPISTTTLTLGTALGKSVK